MKWVKDEVVLVLVFKDVNTITPDYCVLLLDGNNIVENIPHSSLV